MCAAYKENKVPDFFPLSIKLFMQNLKYGTILETEKKNWYRRQPNKQDQPWFLKKNEFTGSWLYHQQGLIETPGVNWDKKMDKAS